MKHAYMMGIIGALVVLAAAWYALSPTDHTASDADSLETVRIGHIPGQFSTNFPMFVGEHTGIFTEHGISVVGEALETKIAVPALISGSVDYIPISREGAAASLKDVDLKLVTVLSTNQLQYVLARTGTALANISSIAVPTTQSSSHYLALLAFERNGFSANVVDAGNSVPATRAMLLQGKTDAAILSYLAPIDFEAEGFSVLDDFGDDGLIIGLTTREKTINENPQQVQRVVDAFKAVATYIQAHPEETRELLYAYYEFTDRTEAQARKVDTAYEAAQRYFSTTGMPTDEQMHRLVQTARVVEFETLADIHTIEVTDADIAKVFDLRFVE